MATYLPGLLGLGRPIEIQNPYINRSFYGSNPVTGPFADRPFLPTPFDFQNFTPRAERIALAVARREEEEARKREEQRNQATSDVVREQVEQGGPDGSTSNVQTANDFADLYGRNFDTAGMLGGLLGGPVGSAIGIASQIGPANEFLDKQFDVFGKIPGQTIGLRDVPSAMTASSTFGLAGTSLNEAVENALNARANASQTQNFVDFGAKPPDFTVTEVPALFDPYAVEIEPEAVSFQDVFGPQSPNYAPSFDELMASGGMSGYGQTFDNLPDIPDTARFDFSDIDEFGNPTVSYDSIGDAIAGIGKGFGQLGSSLFGGDPVSEDLAQTTDIANPVDTRDGVEAIGKAATSQQAYNEAIEAVDTVGGVDTATDPDAVGQTTATTDDMFDPDLPNDGQEDNDAGECFLTTAIVHRRGEADDGPTLTKLRKFRDTFMQDMPNEVEKYYDIAPKIIAAIPENHSDWDFIQNQIDSAIRAIDKKKNNSAYQIYKSMVTKLKNDWLKEK